MKQNRRWHRGWHKWTVVLGTFVFVVPLLTGCWDQLSIEQRATILGLAVDVKGQEIGTDSASKSTNMDKDSRGPSQVLELTAHIAVPGRIPLGPGQGEGGNQGKTLWILHVQGRTLEGAISNLQQQVADRLFFGHLRIIVVSHTVAEKGIRDMSDYLRRNPEIRRNAWLIVSETRAERVMETSPPLERVPTLYLQSGMDHAKSMGKLPNLTMGRFWSVLDSEGREPVLPYVRIKGKDNIETAGLVLFKNDKMIGHTTPIQIASFMEVKNLNPAGYSALTPIPGYNAEFMFSAIHRKSKVRLRMTNGTPHFTIRIHVDGNITETHPDKALTLSPAMIQKLSLTEAKVIQDADLKFIRQTQAEGTDVFGLGEYVRGLKPRYWADQVKTKKQWEAIYRTIPIDIKVTTRIHRTGMMGR